ncbi:ArsR/SmtB family transcription factor [Halobellus captivus]|uniref:ArsR/SmtB family transcription factor n=1 Tax=Halobellus captivus TaxID=2592614 RepID=UPI0011A8955E|nr:metalloregulator ArsR/SmtB family transcription factor [Halobellus captivus]
MSTATRRLQRYLEDELVDCRSEDVDRRLDELDALESVLSDEQIGADLDVLSALSNETRYKLVRLLVAAEEELCVCELNAMVDASESAISHALGTLTDAGVVIRRKDGRWRKYRASNVAVSLVTLLDGLGPSAAERPPASSRDANAGCGCE